KGKEPERVGNFDITQQEGLLTVAGMFPEFKESPLFAKNAVERLIRFQQQVMLPDGVISEYVPSYHMAYPRQFLKAPKFCARYGIKADFPPEYLDRVAKGVYAVVIWSHPDGTSPLFGDAWLGSPGGNNEYVAKFLEDFNRPDFRYFATRGAEGVAPAGKIHQLPDAGYTTIRSDWSDKALFVVAKNTNPSRHQWHSHFDNLSFELSAFGRRFMTDSGCYNYSGEPEWRAWFRRPQAHQMVTMDDLPVNSRGKTVFTKSVPGLDAAVLENEVNAGLTQRRSFILVENRFFIVLDELKGAATGTLQAHFQLDPAPWQLDPKRLAARTMYGDGPNLVVKGAALPGVELVEEEGWFSPKYMEKTRRPAFAFVQVKPDDKPRYFLTLLAPLPKERQLFDAKIAFFRDGKPTVEPGSDIYVRLNYSEHFLITLDPAAGTLTLKKGRTEPYDQAETRLFNTGSWQEPPVPDFSAAVESQPAKANDSSPRLRIDIFNEKGSQVTYRDVIAPPGGGTSPVTWGAPESRKFGAIMQSPPLAAKKQDLTFSFVPEADGVLKVSFLGNDVKIGDKRQELWAEFSGVTFDGALNAAELAKANAAPRQVWHQKPYAQLIKVKKGEKITIRCQAGIPEKK
ncbi:MAG: alginate lyase family protein, partial [Victivallaceae bacterium]